MTQEKLVHVCLANFYIDDNLQENIVWNKEKLGFRTQVAELLGSLKQEVLGFYDSFRMRGILALRRLESLPPNLNEEKARFWYRVIASELWLRK